MTVQDGHVSPECGRQHIEVTRRRSCSDVEEMQGSLYMLNECRKC